MAALEGMFPAPILFHQLTPTRFGTYGFYRMSDLLLDPTTNLEDINTWSKLSNPGFSRMIPTDVK